jgi:hypothetical protein
LAGGSAGFSPAPGCRGLRGRRLLRLGLGRRGRGVRRGPGAPRRPARCDAAPSVTPMGDPHRDDRSRRLPRPFMREVPVKNDGGASQRPRRWNVARDSVPRSAAYVGLRRAASAGVVRRGLLGGRGSDWPAPWLGLFLAPHETARGKRQAGHHHRPLPPPPNVSTRFMVKLLQYPLSGGPGTRTRISRPKSRSQVVQGVTRMWTLTRCSSIQYARESAPAPATPGTSTDPLPPDPGSPGSARSTAFPRPRPVRRLVPGFELDPHRTSLRAGHQTDRRRRHKRRFPAFFTRLWVNAGHPAGARTPVHVLLGDRRRPAQPPDSAGRCGVRAVAAHPVPLRLKWRPRTPPQPDTPSLRRRTPAGPRR